MVWGGGGKRVCVHACIPIDPNVCAYFIMLVSIRLWFSVYPISANSMNKFDIFIYFFK